MKVLQCKSFIEPFYGSSEIVFLTLKIESGVSMNANFIWEALHDLVPFAQFRKRGKYPWRSDNYSQPATLLKITLLHWWFVSFVNCTKGTVSCKASLFWKCKKQLHNTCCFGMRSLERNLGNTVGKYYLNQSFLRLPLWQE